MNSQTIGSSGSIPSIPASHTDSTDDSKKREIPSSWFQSEFQSEAKKQRTETECDNKGTTSLEQNRLLRLNEHIESIVLLSLDNNTYNQYVDHLKDIVIRDIRSTNSSNSIYITLIDQLMEQSMNKEEKEEKSTSLLIEILNIVIENSYCPDKYRYNVCVATHDKQITLEDFNDKEADCVIVGNDQKAYYKNCYTGDLQTIKIIVPEDASKERIIAALSLYLNNIPINGTKERQFFQNGLHGSHVIHYKHLMDYCCNVAEKLLTYIKNRDNLTDTFAQISRQINDIYYILDSQFKNRFIKIFSSSETKTNTQSI